jgi:hypothetical protein
MRYILLVLAQNWIVYVYYNIVNIQTCVGLVPALILRKEHMMRRRRSGRDHLSDIFYNTGDMRQRTVDESFGYSREFTDMTRQEMLEGERLQRKHRLEKEQQQNQIYPSCDINDRPNNLPNTRF